MIVNMLVPQVSAAVISQNDRTTKIDDFNDKIARASPGLESMPRKDQIPEIQATRKKAPSTISRYG
jgi:hypothetical protein